MKKKFSFSRSCGLILIGVVLSGCPAAKQTEPAVEGKLVIKGSNTIGEELAPKLIAEYKKERPKVTVELESKGTASGFAALFAYGTIVLIGVSRDEEESFLQKLGDRIESRLDAPVIHRIGDRDRNKREDLGRSHHGPGSAAAVSCRRCRRACQECRARL